MNFAHLVESGKYNPEEIEGDWWRGYVAGITAATEGLEGFAGNYDDAEPGEVNGHEVEGDSLHERLYNSVAREVLAHAALDMRSTYYEAVVAALDDETA